MSDWIALKDELPKLKEEVLVCWQSEYREKYPREPRIVALRVVGEVCRDDRKSLSLYTPDYGSYGAPGKPGGPTHWRPIPAPVEPLNDCEPPPGPRNIMWESAMRRVYPWRSFLELFEASNAPEDGQDV